MSDTQALSEQVRREFMCRHAQTGLTYIVASNQSVHYRTQCVRCGANTGAIRKAELSPTALKAATPFNESLERSWSSRRSQRYTDLKAEAEQERSAEWHAWYETYLASLEWRRRRALVMKRAKGICEGCLVRQAEHVHHLTYDRVGHEMLFDLVAVCAECHDTVHASKESVAAS